MDKLAFKELFLKLAAESIGLARSATNKTIPNKFVVELHGAGISGTVMDYDEALKFMYIDEDKFYQHIDIGFKEIKDDASILFVRISAYKPTEFSKTWNTPRGNGPFRIMIPMDKQ